MLSKKDSCGEKGSFKYFIGYINETDAFPVSLRIKLLHMNRYVKYFDSNSKCMNLSVHDKELLKNYNETWDKISNLLKKEFDSIPVYDNKYIKTKTKIYNNKINTNFQGEKIPEDNEYCTCLSAIFLDSVVKTDNDCYPLDLLEDFKYAVKKKKIIYAIN